MDDDDGQWIPTENGHHVHLNSEGVPDKGNSHVLAAMSGKGGSGSTSPTKFPSSNEERIAFLASRGIDDNQFWQMVMANGGNALHVWDTISKMPPRKN